MKKILAISLTSLSLLMLAACSDYNLNSRAIITDAKIVSLQCSSSGCGCNQTITFKKDGEKEHTFRLNDDTSNLKYAVESINKTNAIIGSNEELLYDIVLEDDTVISVSLSKNRK